MSVFRSSEAKSSNPRRSRFDNITPGIRRGPPSTLRINARQANRAARSRPIQIPSIRRRDERRSSEDAYLTYLQLVGSPEDIRLYSRSPPQEKAEINYKFFLSKKLHSKLRQADLVGATEIINTNMLDLNKKWISRGQEFYYIFDAIGPGKNDILRMLIRNGASVDIVLNTSLMHRAVVKGNLETLQILYEAGADFNLYDKNQKTPLDLAEDQFMIEKVEFLKSIGAEKYTQKNSLEGLIQSLDSLSV